MNVLAKNQIDIVNNYTRYRQKALDTLTFAAVNMKFKYNSKYKALIIEKEDKAFIKLYREYYLLELENMKLSN